jgi:hypothetical protein
MQQNCGSQEVRRAPPRRGADVAGLFDKARQLANSEQGEKVTDKLLDTVSDIASKRTGGKHDAQIESARKAADKALGRQDRGSDKQ